MSASSTVLNSLGGAPKQLTVTIVEGTPLEIPAKDLVSTASYGINRSAATQLTPTCYLETDATPASSGVPFCKGVTIGGSGNTSLIALKRGQAADFFHTADTGFSAGVESFTVSRDNEMLVLSYDPITASTDTAVTSSPIIYVEATSTALFGVIGSGWTDSATQAYDSFVIAHDTTSGRFYICTLEGSPNDYVARRSWEAGSAGFRVSAKPPQAGTGFMCYPKGVLDSTSSDVLMQSNAAVVTFVTAGGAVPQVARDEVSWNAYPIRWTFTAGQGLDLFTLLFGSATPLPAIGTSSSASGYSITRLPLAKRSLVLTLSAISVSAGAGDRSGRDGGVNAY